jgi:Ulp1 family protease
VSYKFARTYAKFSRLVKIFGLKFADVKITIDKFFPAQNNGHDCGVFL